MDVNSRQTILFANVLDYETFTYPLILVKGCISEARSDGELTISYLKNGVSTQNVKVTVQDDRFVVLLELEPGRNEFSFDIEECTAKKVFFYVQPVERCVVTPVYILCHDVNIGSMDDQNVAEICRKILFGCRLIQTLIAETLFQCGFKKNTFLLERHDENGNNDCLVFNSKLPLNTATNMSSEELWEYLGREIMTSEHGSRNRKFLAFLSRSKNEFSEHLAIGGGGLALCDAEYLRTWPASMRNISSYFAYDSESFESTNTPNSSFGASLGAVCHELCHTFDLGHTVDGIMGRDFDRVSLLFVVVDKKNRRGKTSQSPNFNCIRSRNDSLVICEGTLSRKLNINFSVTRDSDACVCGDRKLDKPRNINDIFPKTIFWFGGCATLLAYHRWINHARSVTEQVKSNILHYDHVRSIITSANGIVVVQLRNQDGYILKYWEFCGKKKKTLFLVPICEVRRACSIVIEDLDGNLLKRDIEHLF